MSEHIQGNLSDWQDLSTVAENGKCAEKKKDVESYLLVSCDGVCVYSHMHKTKKWRKQILSI